MNAISQDRFARLRALQGAQAATRKRADSASSETHGTSPDIPAGAARLAEILGATPSRNKFGEHLALRRWFSESISCEAPAGRLDAAARRLLAPDAPHSVADPEQWLFLDTETTGIVGGTG